jgi:hypothetical protein
MKNLEQEAIYAISCARYESDKLDFSSKSVIKMSQLFVFSLAHCEHIAEYKTDFNLDKFAYEIKELVKYYSYYKFPFEFVQNGGEYGLLSVMKKVVQTPNNPNEKDVYNNLANKYRFFGWKV